MTSRAVLAALVGVALLAALLSFASAGNLRTAVPTALLATGAAATAAGLGLAERTKWRRPTPVAVPEDPGVALRDSLRGSALGRQTAIAHLKALERRLPTAIVPISPEEEARVLRLPRSAYLRWVDARVSAIEAAT